MKDMSRALRRHHAARLKRARRFYSGMDNRTDPRRLGRLLHTATLCSCWMCGNTRRHLGPTIAERLHAVKLAESTPSCPNALREDCHGYFAHTSLHTAPSPFPTGR